MTTRIQCHLDASEDLPRWNLGHEQATGDGLTGHRIWRYHRSLRALKGTVTYVPDSKLRLVEIMGMGSGFGRDLIVAGMVLFLTGMTIATVGVPSFEETTQPAPSIPQDDADEPSRESTGDDAVRLSGGSDVDADHTMEKDERVGSVVAPDGVDEAKLQMKDRARIDGDIRLAAVRDGTKITFKDAVGVGGNASFGDVDDSDVTLGDQTEIAGDVLIGSVTDSSVVFKDRATSHGDVHIETIGDDGEVKIDGETTIEGNVVIERIEADGEFELDSDATIAGELLIGSVDADSDLDIEEEAVEGEVRINGG